MAPGLIDFATEMTAPSKAARFVAAPAPMPLVLVGVFTLTKTTSATAMQPLMSVENERFGDLAGMVNRSMVKEVSLVPSRAIRTMRSKPGS